MPAVSRERHSTTVVPAGNDVPILILEIRFGTIIDHVDRIVVKHFELRVKFVDIIPSDRSGREHFVAGPAEQGQRQSGSARKRIADFVRFVEQQADFVGPLFHKGFEPSLQFFHHRQRDEQKDTFRNFRQFRGFVDTNILRPVADQKGFPCQIDGNGRSQHDHVFDLLQPIHRIAAEMVSHGRLARSLLPVQQGIAFLEQQSHILLLQRSELALLQFLVAESQPIDVCIDSGIGSHFRERGLLTQKFLSFAGNQFFGLPVLLFLLFVLPGQFG